jgi:hypothetical protein
LPAIVLGCLRADNSGFDQQVVWPANHDQMFDIVTPDQNQLALGTNIFQIDLPQP